MGAIILASWGQPVWVNKANKNIPEIWIGRWERERERERGRGRPWEQKQLKELEENETVSDYTEYMMCSWGHFQVCPVFGLVNEIHLLI